MKNKILILLVLISTVAFSQGSKTTKSTKPKQTVTINVSTDAIKYSENNKVDEIIVDGKDILVSGNENKLTFKGNIGKILITGKNNDILIESVNQIIVPGDGNFVSWEKSSNTNSKPIVVDKGGYNNVEKKSDNAMDRSGN